MSTYRKPYQGRLSPHKSLEQVSSREIVPPAFKTVAPPLGGVGEPTLTDRPESGVSSEGGGGRRLNFRRPGPNLKGNLKGQFTVSLLTIYKTEIREIWEKKICTMGQFSTFRRKIAKK